MNPLVSVIVPTYNRRELLPRCLDAIRAQSYKPLEIILVDDGSTDGTPGWAESAYGRAIRCIVMPHSGFPGVVRNVGIENSRGEYIAFCDSDDYWLPEKIEFQMERLNTSGCNFSCSDAFLPGEDAQTVLGNYRFRYPSPDKCLLWENFIVTSSVVVQRQVLSASRFSDADARMFPVFQDYVLWLSLLDDLRIDFIPKPLVHYGINASSISWAGRKRNPQLQIKILFTQPAFRRHPLIAVQKFLRYCKPILTGAR